MRIYNNDRQNAERVIGRIKERTKDKAKESEYYFRRGRVLWRLKEQNVLSEQLEQRFELEMMLEEEVDKRHKEKSSIKRELSYLGFTTPEVNKILEKGSVGN